VKVRRWLSKCTAKIGHGPGHQSTSTCDILGPHRQHLVQSHDLYWSGPSRKLAFTGYFDESPEEPGEPAPRRKRKTTGKAAVVK
jgi:hypothetical protein